MTPVGSFRAYNICLRLFHLAMNFMTWAFVKSGNSTQHIDNTSWPITIDKLITDGRTMLEVVSNTLKQSVLPPYKGTMHPYIGVGHLPSVSDFPNTISHQLRVKLGITQPLSIGVVTLCAYPEGHLLTRYSVANKQQYVRQHSYGLLVETERVDERRPHAWGKIKLMIDTLSKKKWEWVMWMDCDSLFMDFNVSIEALLYKYSAIMTNDGYIQMDPEVEQFVSEDASMLNTGIFFMKSTEKNVKFLQKVWGDTDNPWIEHPWWENAAMAYEYLKDLHKIFINEDHHTHMTTSNNDYMSGIYPKGVVVLPQWEVNSYHPITSRFQHDTWEPGRFILSFSGCPSHSSTEVMNHLYGNYYRKACELNAHVLGGVCPLLIERDPWN
eukprot:GHVR01151880.1.p1 GENE.GHVR01151880.1~~GHVR01151880.1.p1  ORF type:complete len:447 (-),score=57.37 GHVR01151880.1:43-1188(-)